MKYNVEIELTIIRTFEIEADHVDKAIENSKKEAEDSIVPWQVTKSACVDIQHE